MYEYKCEYCGANLDPGEKCDCKIRNLHKKEVKDYGKLISIQSINSRH